MTAKPAQRGVSLLELIVVLAVLTLVIGVALGYMAYVQKRYSAEQEKVDITQQARELLDHFVRDLQQAGYPGAKMYAPGVLMTPASQDARAAVGLVSVSATDLWLEADVDSDGEVESVRYSLEAGGACPCRLLRSEVVKINATDPMSQPVANNVALEGVINSGDAGGPGPNGSLEISGSMFGRSNSELYNAYRSQAVFTAFDHDGNAVTLPVDVSGPKALSKVASVRITVNLLSPYPDGQTLLRPAVSLTAAGKL